MIIYINGRGMNAPELKAYISELEAENAELRAKVESAERQKTEYKRLLKAAVEDMNKEADCGICLHDNDSECPIKVTACKFKWRHAAEALALIGEEGENDA